MITKWTNIKSVLFELERSIPKEFYNEGRLIEDCMKAVDKIGAIVTYQQAVKFIKVENYKACIPLDCLQIIQIAHKNTFDITDNEIAQLEVEMGINNDPAMSNSTLAYQALLASKSYKNNWTPLRLSTNSFALAVHCDNCVNIGNNCAYEYSVSPDGTMTFNFKTGFICIAYYAYPVDCDNIPLIPDDEDYKEALKDYCLMTSWELRWNMKEEGAEQRYMKYQQLWGLMKAKATASVRMPDVAGAENLKNVMNRLIPKSRRFNSFFSNLNSEENLKMTGFSSGYYYR